MVSDVQKIDAKYNVRPLIDPEPTNIDVNPLKLDSIDLSLFKDGSEYLGQRKQLAKSLEKSITSYGFFNIHNYGISRDEVENIRAISQSALTLPDNIKQKYLASASRKEDELNVSVGGERGQGYKPKGYWAIKNNVRDSIVHYNFRNTFFDSFLEEPEKHPEIIAAHLQEIANFYNKIHRVVLPKLLSLCDLILDIPEGTLLNNYFQNSGTNLDDSESHGRLMLYEPYENPEESKITNRTWLRGHSDISAFSFITSQSILALQIRDIYSGDWRYVDHRPDSLIVNIGDSMEFITGGLFKACLHRVIEPPEDQRNLKRLVIIYFCNPSKHSQLDPDLLNSKKLDELGLNTNNKLKNWEKIHFSDWNEAKGKLLGKSAAGERNLLKYHGRYIERWHHIL